MQEPPASTAPVTHVDRDKRGDWIKIVGAIVGFTLLGVLADAIDSARKADQATVVQVAPAIIGTPPLGVASSPNPAP